MKSYKKPQVIFISYGSFVALSAFVAFGMILASPSEPGNTVLLGLSLTRLALALGLFIVFIIFVVLAIKAASDGAWAEKKLEGWFGRSRFSRVLVWLGGISFGLGWTGIFLPSYRVGRLENYWLRVQPLMLFILLAGVATLTILYTQHKKSGSVGPSNSGIIRLSMGLFTACLLVLAIMLSSGFGVRSLDDFWYGAGVPILLQQLVGAVAGGLICLQLEKRWGFKHFDLLIFVLIFIITAVLWAREPLQKGFSFVSYPPNHELYPLYDAAFFDSGSQFPLIGQRIFLYGTYFFERPLYPGFLVYLHALFGQNYEILMAGQAAVFAIFPALLYLIGRSLNLRAVGFAAALTAMFRGINAIAASSMIDLANPKMMLTDFPAAIGVALVVLAVCEWLKQPHRRWQYALWVGGAIGFTLMLRTNALMLLALIPVYALFKFSRDWKNWLLNSFVLVLAIIAITLPWELRNRSLGGHMYGPIISKFRAVIDQRYTAPSEPESSIPQLPVTQSTRVLYALHPWDDLIQRESTCSTVACFVPNHFLHNILTSLLVLPASPIMDDLRHTVRDNLPYWYPDWDGKFTVSSLFFFIVNILLITAGVSIAWKQGRLRGLAPLAVFLFYNLSNAFARTSGGRYVVPMDWIVTIYFLIGVFQVVVWLARTLGVPWEIEIDPAAHDRVDLNPAILPKAFLAVFILLGFGSLLPLAENMFKERYQNMDPARVLMENTPILETVGFDVARIETFLQNTNAEIRVGRALYPRYFLTDQQEAVFFPSLPLPFPRTTFDLIGPNGQKSVVLPGDKPQHFPHASDVLVIGCREQYYFDALIVLILDETHTVYARSPSSELGCPLQQPVCDDNSACQ